MDPQISAHGRTLRTMVGYNWMVAFAVSCLVLLSGMAMGHAFVKWIDTLPLSPLPEAVPVEVTGRTDDRAGWQLFAFILRNNFAVYVLLLFGLVSAGSVTFVILLGNGIAIGQVIGFARLAGMSNDTLIDLLLPHGVLELGTLCVAGAVGLQGFRFVLDLSNLGSGTLKSLRLGLVLGFGLCALTVAAVVEAFVTAELAG